MPGWFCRCRQVRSGAGWNGTQARGSLLALFFAVGLPGPAASQQPAVRPAASVEERELLLRLKERLAEAQALFDDPQRQSQSIEYLTQLVNAVDDETRTRGAVSEEMITLQKRARELRAIASFNAGNLTGAADDFRQLIIADARHTLDRELLSPKIVDFFEDQKKKLVGYIAVNTEPAGARVTVNGVFYGVTNLFLQEIIVGQHRVEVTLSGYDTIVRDARILPQETLALDLVLVRTAAALPVITQPADVEVMVDGESRGRTSGTLRVEFRSFIDPAQYNVEQLSDLFQLSPLPLGQHLIELRKECYQTVRFQFEADEPKDYTAQIVKLEESVGRIKLTSTPPAARVFLDGEYKGNTPLDLNRVCSGPHRFEVKHATGKYVEELELEKDETITLDCPIRPTLAFLGVVGEEGVSRRDLDEIGGRLTAELSKITAMNFVVLRPEQVAAVLAGRGPVIFASKDVAGARADASPDQVRDLSEKLGTSLEVEALLVAYVPAQRLVKDVWLNLLAKGATAPDAYMVNYLDPEGVGGFLARLSAPTPLYGSWIGLTTVDTRLTEGATVLKVDSEGPAASSGIQMGEVVIEADGAPVKTTRELLEKGRAKEPGATLALKVRTPDGAGREVPLQVGRTAVELPLNQPGYLYNKAIIDMRHRMVADPPSEGLARLNLALGHIELRDYEAALKEHLPKIKIPGSQGICQGTVYYYMGFAYQMLGERADAARWYREALKYAEATLQSNDGPRVKPLAERRLRELGQ